MGTIAHIPNQITFRHGNWTPMITTPYTVNPEVPRDPREAAVTQTLPELHVPSSLLADSAARARAAQREERAGFLLALWDGHDRPSFDKWVVEFNDDGILTPLGMVSLDAYARAAVVLKRSRMVICNGE